MTAEQGASAASSSLHFATDARVRRTKWHGPATSSSTWTERASGAIGSEELVIARCGDIVHGACIALVCV